ncbi:MAG: LysM peptidoglycan-binding domain-containing protein [Syntrophales bacterium LBB04]|nr:LysM peptidoglycan-binding domain-containing protein [Syntrophales bacterium LBB04]
MGNLCLRSIYLILLSLAFLTVISQDSLAEEDTAHLSFQKTATLSAKTRPYVVKEGEWLFHIMRAQAGIKSHRLTVIKQLNPEIKDLNKIKPGQVVILPGVERPPVQKGEESSQTMNYTVSKGDSISRIAMRELNIKLPELRKAVDDIRQLNPDIRNYNMIYPGQTLQLPRRSIVITKQEAKAKEAESTPKVVKDEAKDKPIILPRAHLDIIKVVISRMNGSLITLGKYYIPIPELGQVTIDCSTIPIVELDDGSSIFLDFGNRMPDTLKNMIQSNWKNYHSVEIVNSDDTAAILQKIVNASNTYSMTRRTTPYTIGAIPPLQLSLDWIITKRTKENKPYLQGLSFVSDNARLLPKPLTQYAARNDMIMTEILDGQGVAGAPDEKYTLPQMSNMNVSTNMELVNSLLYELGYQIIRDSEVGILDAAASGFDLSIKADLLAKKGDKQIIIISKKIPQQFIYSLKTRGTDTISLDVGETKKSVIEKILKGANIPFSFASFSFSVPEKTDKPTGTISFPAFKITRDTGDFYLIDFDIDRDIYGLLNNKWEVNIVRY